MKKNQLQMKAIATTKATTWVNLSPKRTTVRFHLYEVQGQAELMHSDSSQYGAYRWVVQTGRGRKEPSSVPKMFYIFIWR